MREKSDIGIYWLYLSYCSKTLQKWNKLELKLASLQVDMKNYSFANVDAIRGLAV